MQPKCFPDKRANDCAGRRMTTVLIGHVHEGAGLETDCWTSLREMMMMIIKRQREKRHIQPKRSKQKKREKKNGQFNQKLMKIKILFTLMLFQTYGSLFPPHNRKMLKVIESLYHAIQTFLGTSQNCQKLRTVKYRLKIMSQTQNYKIKT